jgi:diguanylate cyclase (GGDEF)-like protein
MLPTWIKRIGPNKLIILLTFTTVLFSVGISSGLRLLLEGSVSLSGLIISATVPLLLTPVIAFFFTRVLFELDAARAQLELLSITDDLTLVYNRRYFLGRAHYELARARRYGQVFSMLLIDLDYFKLVNDEYGHPAGDQLLKMVSDVCLRESREVDVLARLGGDEFGFLIPGLEQDQAVAFANRLRNNLDQSSVLYRGVRIKTTVSVGVITWEPAIKDLDALIFLMDKALYAAKHGGKNKTVVARLDAENLVDWQLHNPGN